MGQVEDRQNVRPDGRGRPQGQALHRKLTSLAGAVAALLALSVIAACQASAPTPASLPQKTQAASLQFDQKLAWSHLLKQVEFGPRVPGTEAHKKCRDWIAEEMKKHCTNVRFQEFTHTWSENKQKITMWNILGEQNWENAKVRVVLLAHWDTRPHANEDPNPANRKKPVLGANDGASGVAVLLEVMRVLKDRIPGDLGILYLMTDGEDLGPELNEMFLGAGHFSKNLPKPKPEYGILLDMVGAKNVRIPIEMNGYAAAKNLVLAFYDNAQKVGLSRAFPPTFGSQIYDDHLALIDAGIPTMDLIDFNHLDHWHTVTDTPENCAPESLGQVGKAVESWLLKNPPYKHKS